MAQRKESPSQTAGPYVQIGCMPHALGLLGWDVDLGARMKTGPVQGQDITVRGTIRDGEGALVQDALIEIWQADAAGLFPSANETRGRSDPNFTGWGRAACKPDTGIFTFDTVKPGRVPWHDGTMQAPHVTLWIVARGINIGLHTRLYFADEPEANAVDPILSAVPADRRSTLLANKDDDGAYHFDIRLQGPNETIFFDI